MSFEKDCNQLQKTQFVRIQQTIIFQIEFSFICKITMIGGSEKCFIYLEFDDVYFVKKIYIENIYSHTTILIFQSVLHIRYVILYSKVVFMFSLTVSVCKYTLDVIDINQG